MKFRPAKSLWVIAAFVFLSITSSVITPLSAHADIFADWVLYPSNMSEGYFSNNGVTDTQAAHRRDCGYSRCPVIPNGNYSRESITGSYFRAGNDSNASSIARAYQLVADLKTIYGRGGWDSAGAAFVVNTMLGISSDSPNKTRSISTAMWNDLQARIVNRAETGHINWNIDFSSNGRDTLSRIIDNQWDVVYNNTSETRNGIIFYTDSGAEAYRIWYSCGNPSGTFDGLPLVKKWAVSGKSTIQVGANASTATDVSKASSGTLTAKPGNRLNWYHSLTNSGPDGMDKSVSWSVGKTGFSNGWNAVGAPGGNSSGGANALFVAVYASQPGAYSIYDVTQSDVGNTLCQQIRWSPMSSTNAAASASGYACAAVPYDYTLVPEITNVTDNTITESVAGARSLVGRVTNTGITKSHTNIQWQTTQVRYAPGVAINNKSGGTSASNPCAYFNGNAQCGATTSGTGTEANGYAKGVSTLYNSTTNPSEQPIGTRLCFAMSIKRNSSASTDWRHSQLYCLIVGKKPKVQVLGSDLIVGRGSGVVSRISTSTTRVSSSGLLYGSWSEYGIAASGVVSGMASGAGYVDGSTKSGLCSFSVLTFANSNGSSCSDGNIGNYSNSDSAPNIASRFPTSSTTQNITNPSINIVAGSMSGLYASNLSALTVTGGSAIPVGRWVVINAPNTTVTIGGDIRYTPGSISNIKYIPQVVIIAKNIIIADGVTNVDAWLIATGTGGDGRINTCGAGAVTESSGITSLTCSQKLTVNGPVVANHLIMRRTAGAGLTTQAGDPAEVFNLRADAYLWASAYSSSTGRLPTVTTKELPPRF